MFVMVRFPAANAVEMPEPAEYVVEAIQVGTPPEIASTWPPVPVPKSVEVANATTLPVAPVLLPRMVFAAT